MMDGPWQAKEFVTNYLQIDLPVRVIEYRNRWQLDSARLPTPEAYFAHEPIGLDIWPSIITVQINTASIERTDYVNSTTDPNYRVTYNMRTYVWVRGIGPDETTENRDRLTTVVRSALLDHPAMVRAEDRWFPSISAEALLDESTMREEYSDLTYGKGDRVIAGAYIAYEFTLNEVISRVPLGAVSAIGADVVPMERIDLL
jgi:hypothetical protein